MSTNTKYLFEIYVPTNISMENGQIFVCVDFFADRPPHHHRNAIKLDPLVTEGPWSAYLDQDNTGMVYYFNSDMGESLWEPPTDTFPLVSMDKETREVAWMKQTESLEHRFRIA
jgi:hypothetical protein